MCLGRGWVGGVVEMVSVTVEGMGGWCCGDGE